MTDLIPLCALGGTAPRRAAIGGLTLAENPAPVLHSLVADGAGLPGPGRFHDGAFWTGPGQWMLERPAPAGAITTDQSDAWAVFEIDGPVEQLLEKLMNIDIAAFEPGSATRTGLEHMSVFVIRRSETAVCIMAMRSAAESVWHAIENAARNLEAA